MSEIIECGPRPVLFRIVWALSLSAMTLGTATIVGANQSSACTAKKGKCSPESQNARWNSGTKVTIYPPEINTGMHITSNASIADNECVAEPADDLPFKISVDGQTLGSEPGDTADDPNCTDVELKRADIQIRYDGLDVKPQLNVNAAPDATLKGGDVVFSTYANYQQWLDRGEIRIFKKGDTTRQAPLAVIATKKGLAHWNAPSGQDYEVTYVLRVYDPKGRFDETAPKILKLADIRGGVKSEVDLAVVYASNSLKVHNIPVSGGAVLVSGHEIPQ